MPEWSAAATTHTWCLTTSQRQRLCEAGVAAGALAPVGPTPASPLQALQVGSPVSSSGFLIVTLQCQVRRSHCLRHGTLSAPPRWGQCADARGEGDDIQVRILPRGPWRHFATGLRACPQASGSVPL